MAAFVEKIPWAMVIVLCLTLGLAPYGPPHVWEKLRLLMQGRLVRPLDWFDFLMHGLPWGLLVVKAFFAITK